MPLPLLAPFLIASLFGKAAKTKQGQVYERQMESAAEEQKEKTKKAHLRAAMARALGVDDMPYINPTVERPEAPNTAWADIIGGLGDLGVQAVSMDQAGKLFPMPKKTPGSPLKILPKETYRVPT